MLSKVVMTINTWRKRNKSLFQALPLNFLLLTNCDLTQGFIENGNALTNGDASILDQPGRKLVSGQYRDLIIDGNLESGGYVLAIEEFSPDKSQLLVLPFLESEGCALEDASSFVRIASRIEIELPGLLAVQDKTDEEGRGTIRFVGFDCEEKIPALSDAQLPTLIFPNATPRGALILQKNGDLSLINPRSVAREKIANKVTYAQVEGQRLYTIENKRLVIRDEKFTIVAELGRNVTTFTTQASRTLGIAYRDEVGLFIYKNEKTTMITDRGCELSVSGNEVVTSYLDCERKTSLLVFQGESLGTSEDTVVVEGLANTGPLEKIALRRPPPPAQHLEIWLPTESEVSRSSSLALAIIKAEQAQKAQTIDDAENASLELDFRPFAENVQQFGGEYYQNLDDDNIGDLLQLKRDADGLPERFTIIAKNVAQIPGGTPFSTAGVLMNYDREQKTGDLMQLNVDKDKPEQVNGTLIASKVPRQLFQFDTQNDLQVFVANLKDGAGDLMLFEKGKGNAVANPVVPNTIRVMLDPYALIFLSQSKQNNATPLQAWLINDELELFISPDADEYRIIPWPSPGLLYSVPEGKDAGIWLSKAR